jgi:hypothetical protein
VAKANYHQIRRQKELARKTRQQEKQHKRAAAKASEAPVADADSAVSVEEPAIHPTESTGGGERS